MKNLLLLLAVISLFFVSPSIAQKPAPPEQLAKFFKEVVAIEDAVGVKKWDLALQTVAEVGERLEVVAPSIRKAAGDGAYLQLDAVVGELRGALKKKDNAFVSKLLIDLQKQIFNTMEFYDYAVHPAFIVLQEYVAEAVDAVEKQDFERIAHEMKEVANIMSGSAAVMKDKGVGKGMQQDFLDQLFIVMGAAAAKELEPTKLALKKMEKLAGAFVWMGSRQ